MDEKIIEMLAKMNQDIAKMNQDIAKMNQDMKEGFKGVNVRLDKIESKLDGVGGQFEILSSYKIELDENVNDEIDFISDKVTRLEKEVFRMKHKQ